MLETAVKKNSCIKNMRSKIVPVVMEKNECIIQVQGVDWLMLI